MTKNTKSTQAGNCYGVGGVGAEQHTGRGVEHGETMRQATERSSDGKENTGEEAAKKHVSGSRGLPPGWTRANGAMGGGESQEGQVTLQSCTVQVYMQRRALLMEEDTKMVVSRRHTEASK